jgi:hypothetical protein
MFRTLDREYRIYQTVEGYEVRGLLQPADEGTIPAFQWIAPRLIFRTGPESLAKAGDIIVAEGRHFILSGHDTRLTLHKTFRLIECTDEVSWQRKVRIVDPVTRLERENTDTELGPIWVALEPLGRMDVDRNIRVREDARQVLTSADVRLNDTIDGQIVRRLQHVLGVKLLEIG